MSARADELIEVPRTEEEKRQYAIKRIKAKHDFQIHLVVYLIVNAAIVVLWALVGAGRTGAEGFFWPVFPIVGWGIGLVIHGYTTYQGNVISEDQIQREMKQLPS